MLSGAVLKQFRTYLKSQVGHGWSVEGRKSKGRLLTRVSFRYLSGERSVVLLDIDFNAEYQDDIVRNVRKLSCSEIWSMAETFYDDLKEMGRYLFAAEYLIVSPNIKKELEKMAEFKKTKNNLEEILK